MDNLTHTLAGVALSKAGLERRTPLALPALIIAANLPDLDALAYLRDPLFALTFRRGWTHGVLAMVVLPVALAGVMLGWDRMVRLRRRPGAVPAPFRGLLLVSAIGVLSHPLLDLLNTYGVRLLMPFSGRWFHGDALFIIDPWLCGIPVVGTTVSIWKSERGAAQTCRPVQLALALVGCYVALMFGSGMAARVQSAGGFSFARIMAAPVLADPLRRVMLFDLDGSYRRGSFDWRRPVPRLVLEPDPIPRNLDDPTVSTALDHPDARAFLGWSRFPAAVLTPGGVRLYDLRYGDAETDSWASVMLPASAGR